MITVAKGLNMPNGVAFLGDALYVAEVNRVLRYDAIESRLSDPPQPVVVNDSFPKDRHHGWKFISFGPDGLLYIPVGAPCNICESEDARYASIMRMNRDGKGLEIFARGVRNTVGFRLAPGNERALVHRQRTGLDGRRPSAGRAESCPEEGDALRLPLLPRNGHPRSGVRKREVLSTYTQPALELGPHVASLWMRFYGGAMFPAAYRNQIFIAEHGSWNRSAPIGYRITLARLEDNRAVKYDVFAEGWLQDGFVYGRPVDIQEMPDGALLVSDDRRASSTGSVINNSVAPQSDHR